MTTLAKYISAHLDKPFAWGSNDCILFSIGWLEISTGRDFLGIYKPWASAKQALRKVEESGGLRKLFDESLKPINPNFACDGDIALIDDCAYIFSGPHVVSVGESGLVFKNRMDAKCAWQYCS